MLPTKVHIVHTMVFPIVMYQCELDHKEGWGRKIDAFELWCWKRLFRVPCTARRSNQSILKETSPDCSQEGLILKLKLQYLGHLMQRANSLEKIRMLGKTEGRRSGWQRMSWLDGIHLLDGHELEYSGSWWWTGMDSLVCSSPWVHKESDMTERLNWAELNWAEHQSCQI